MLSLTHLTYNGSRRLRNSLPPSTCQITIIYWSATHVKPKTTISGRFGNSSGDWIRTNDLRVIDNNPKSVPFVRQVLQMSQTCERWFIRARHAAIVSRRAYGTAFKGESQELFPFQPSLKLLEFFDYHAGILRRNDYTLRSNHLSRLQGRQLFG